MKDGHCSTRGTAIFRWVLGFASVVGLIFGFMPHTAFQPRTSQELVFLDPRVENRDVLLDELREQRERGRQVDMYVLDAHRDGIAFISSVLARYQAVDAMHLVSHARPGAVQLGRTWLSADRLDAYARHIETWRTSLSSGADLLFYGCDLAANASGRAMLQSLHELTDVDIAASIDGTGHRVRGGNWGFEYRRGVIETDVMFGRDLQARWPGLLTTLTFREGHDGYNGAIDTFLEAGDPDRDNATDSPLEADNSPIEQALIRFDNIFGPGPDQIPFGATITSASLTVNVSNSSDGMATITLHRMFVPWSDSDTWNTLGGGVQADDTEAAVIPDSVLVDPSSLGSENFDGPGLVATLQAWSNGETNEGWVILNDDNNDWEFTSSNSTLLFFFRPRLSVTFDTNSAPTADAGGPYTIAEGDMVVLDASLSTDPESNPLTYAWDINNDSIFGDVTGVMPNLSWIDLQSFGITDGDDVYDIAVEVDDGLGGVDTATTTIAVNNTTPALVTSGAPTTTNGGIYVLNLSATDPGDDSITEWTINWGDGTIETIFGNPLTAVHTYHGIGFTYNILASATDEDGTTLQNELVVPSYTLDSVFRYAATSGDFLQEFATSNGLDDPVQAIVGPDRNLYVSGENSDNVLRYNATTGAFIDEFVLSGTAGLSEPGGIVFGPDVNLYVSNLGGDSILRFDGTTGAAIDEFVAHRSGGLDQPYALVFGPDRHLYVASFDDSEVLRFDGITGAFLGTFVSSGSGGLDTPEQMAFGPDGNLYMTSFVTDNVLRYHGTTGSFIDVFIPAGGPEDLDEPAGLAFGPDGNLYVADYNDALILRYDGLTGAFIDEYVTAGSGGLANPIFISFLPEQQVYVTPSAPPVIALPSGPLDFTEGDLATIIDPSASASDPDSPDFDGGTLTIDFTVGGTAHDRLAIFDQGPGIGNISLSGTDISYDFGAGPVVIGTFAGGASGLDPLVITFNSNSDEISAEALARHITYENISENPDTNSRTVRFVLTDGDESTSNEATTTINVMAANDAPTADIAPNSYNVTEGTPLTLHSTGLSVSDNDAGANSVRVTLSVTEGTLQASAGSTGVSVAGSGSGMVTLDGDLSQLNDLFAGTGGASITYDSDVNPSATATFTLLIDDLGHTGGGGAKNRFRQCHVQYYGNE